MHYLLKNGADASCPESEEGCSGSHKRPTALDNAIRLHKHDLVDILLSYGAKFCANSLRIAAGQGNDDIVKRIIAASGADIKTGAR